MGIQLGFREGGEKEVRQRERISARARTPSGIQLRFREMAKTIAAGPELAVGSNS